MIDVRELRIGNWISIVEDAGRYNDAHVVTDISGNGSIAIHNGDVGVDEYYPIPLTPEILEKAGFKKEEAPYGVWAVLYFPPRMGIRFYDFNSAECDIIQDGKFISFKNSHIKYLHQLQNIYFALTGVELEINGL